MTSIEPLVAGAVSLYLAVAIVVFGRRRAGYRHAAHTISELGEVGAADGRLVSWGVFFPVGLACLVLATRFSAGGDRGFTAAATMLAACVGVGYLTAALFPCDPGSPLWGSTRQAIHNLGGTVEYGGGALALFRLAERTDGALPFQLAGAMVVAGIFGLSFVPPWRGLIQRFAEAALFGGLILAALR